MLTLLTHKGNMLKLNTVDTLRTHGNLNARPGHCHCKHSSEQSGQLEKLYKHAFQGSPIRDAIIGCAELSKISSNASSSGTSRKIDIGCNFAWAEDFITINTVKILLLGVWSWDNIYWAWPNET